jgi:hypothetical protein
MDHHPQHHPMQTEPCQPNFRVGYRSAATPRTTPWNDICDEILLPIGSLLAVFLIAAAVIAMS